METLHIEGGKPLSGCVKVPGAKNAITKLLVASLLSDKKCVFKNVPNIGEVEITVALCKELGMEVDWDRSSKIMQVQTKELKTHYIPQRFSGANRIPILMIGALLGRTSEDIIVPTVGGDCIGRRPVNFHIRALEKLGASIEYRTMRVEGAYFAHAHNGLHGSVINLEYPSVGATENTILAAVRANGKTIIKNAAIEPEIVDLILFLQKMGVTITLDADRKVKIEGTKKFYDVEHTIIPDRIAAASFGAAAVASRGRVFVEGARHIDMIAFLNKLRSIGGGFNIRDDGIEFFYQDGLRSGIQIETDVHPGFHTDWQQPFSILLTQANGASVIHETVYEKRFGYIRTLREMGAHIELFKQCLGNKKCRYSMNNYYHSAIISGPTPLCAKNIVIPDLRAGFAYVMAALIAEGKSSISNLHFLDRGYEDLAEQFTQLGANIHREPSAVKKEKQLV